MKVTKNVKLCAEEMYYNLLHNRQEVILVSSIREPNGIGKLRVAEQKPPEWFSEFANQYIKQTKKYPRIRPKIYRHATLRALIRLMNGDCSTLYTERLLNFINNKLSEGKSLDWIR